MNTREDRKRALDLLEAQVSTNIIQPIKAAWTAELQDAAKSVTDVWPDQLTLSLTALQEALAAYRPLVTGETPITPRDIAIQAIDNATTQLRVDLASASGALVEAKSFKSDADKAIIDKARGTMDQASISLIEWSGELHRFETCYAS